MTMDRYGHLMEGLDDRTDDRLDAIAQSVKFRYPGGTDVAWNANAASVGLDYARGASR